MGRYANSHNRRHQRCGFVLQNHYRSILVDKNSYFLELVRYIHLNPVVTGMVTDDEELRSYRWAGHAGLLNKHKQQWHSTNATLKHFGTTARRAKSANIKFMKEYRTCHQYVDFSSGGLIRRHGGWHGVERTRQEHIICIGDERILGSSEFVESALRHDKLSTEKATTLARTGWDIEKLTEWVCEYTGIDQDDLSAKARGGKLSNAKAILCYLG